MINFPYVYVDVSPYSRTYWETAIVNYILDAMYAAMDDCILNTPDSRAHYFNERLKAAIETDLYRSDLYEYSIICDERNNPPDLVVDGGIAISIWFRESCSIPGVRGVDIIADCNGIQCKLNGYKSIEEAMA